MISLGCPKNLVDSEIMLGRAGAPRLRGRQRPRQRRHGGRQHLRLHRRGPAGVDRHDPRGRRRARGKGVEKVLVAGCMVNRFGDELAREIPEIDGFVGLDQLREVGDVVQLGGGPPLPAPSHMVFDHTAPRLLTTRGYAYLKVAEGCNNPCTFCAIPIWRGRFRSRTIESLVAEAQQLEAAGHRRAEPDRPGHHPLRRGPRAAAATACCGWSRRCSRRPRSPGSASSTPIRPRSTRTCCA